MSWLQKMLLLSIDIKMELLEEELEEEKVAKIKWKQTTGLDNSSKQVIK